MKAILKAVRKAVRNVMARYEVDAYAEGGAYPWNKASHKCITKREAIEWMAMYPRGSMVVVWNRRFHMVAQRTA